MRDQYFLFGKEAVIAYYYGTIEDTKEVIEDMRGAVTLHRVGESAAQLLEEFKGWGDFAQITEKVYKQLKGE